jgi:intein/homing endonuclease
MENKQLLVECITFEADRELLKEAMENPSKPFKVSGILQRKGKKNQNGRIYPDDILEREVSKYLQTFVSERRAMGELDHPECHRVDAQVLTENGWKYLKDVVVGENVSTLNTDTNTFEFNSITRVINEPYSGKMISIKGKNIDVLVTPNHKFILKDRNNKFVEKTAQELIDISKTTKNPHLSIPTVSDNWNGIKYDEYKIDAVNIELISGNQSTDYKIKQTTALNVNAEAWFSFLGFYLAEGHCTNRISNDGYGVYITQNKGEISDRFRDILQKLSPELTWNEWDKGDNAITFNTSDARLWTYLSKLGTKYTKYIPQEIKNASTDLLQNLYDWFLNGDGTVVGEYDRTSIFSVSKKLMEDFHEIILKLGLSGVIKEQITSEDYMFAGRLIESKNKSPLYRLWIKTSHAIHLDFRFIKIEEIDYNDRVYCVTVKNGNFYCRDHNHAFWSGNSSVVNLKNVSHNIIEMHWQGDDLVGTVEVLTTPNGNILRELFKNGIKLGISSRGMGTLKKSVQEGTAIVGDDFELIAFDFVSNPSTQGAFMAPQQGQISLAENVVKNPINNRWEKTEDIIRNILTELG